MYVIVECFADEKSIPYIGEAEYTANFDWAIDRAIELLADHLEDDDAAEEFRERFKEELIYAGERYSICIGELNELS